MLDGIKNPKFKNKPEEQFNLLNQKNKFSKKKIIWLIFIILILIIVGGFIYKAGFTFSKIINIKDIAWEKIFGKLPSSEYMPPKDEDRINVLFLGIGGEEHPEGGLLTDSIMIVSFKKSSGQIALISIPRDLYVKMPGENYSNKINSAYVLGEKKYQNGLDFSKKTLSYVSGLYIDYAVLVDFKAFKEAIDILGGINIYLEETFIEDKQWWCDENGQNCRPFIVEAGRQTLDGEKALLYARSRFSSDDFDRARRQQQIMIAVKDKVLSLGILANPLIINSLFNTVAETIEMDIKPWEIPSLITLAQNANTDSIKKKIFDISEEGLLYQTIDNGVYMLLPVEGNFNKLRNTCQEIFN